jgi:hypothetical protein
MLRSLGAKYGETVERGRSSASLDSVLMYEHTVAPSSAACPRGICCKEMGVKRSEPETDTEIIAEPSRFRRLILYLGRSNLARAVVLMVSWFTSTTG